MDVLHISLWMCPISGHGCIPYQVMDYSISGRGCTPYQVKDVSFVILWMCPRSGHRCTPNQVVDVPHIKSRVCPMSVYGCAPYTVPESSLTQDTPPRAFPIPCSPTPCVSYHVVYRVCLVHTKPSPMCCWLPELYDLSGFHFSAPDQGPQKAAFFFLYLTFPHFCAGSTVYLK